MSFILKENARRFQNLQKEMFDIVLCVVGEVNSAKSGIFSPVGPMVVYLFIKEKRKGKKKKKKRKKKKQEKKTPQPKVDK